MTLEYHCPAIKSPIVQTLEIAEGHKRIRRRLDWRHDWVLNQIGNCKEKLSTLWSPQ